MNLAAAMLNHASREIAHFQKENEQEKTAIDHVLVRILVHIHVHFPVLKKGIALQGKDD